jgi:uncharacterized alkaline shock family protein YloU
LVTLKNQNGTVTIAREVFTQLAGDAATSCFGVKGMTVRSVTDGLVHLLRRESMSRGVRVTYDDTDRISIELHIGVDAGVNIPVICESIKSEVRFKLESATGIDVERVDIFVDSMILG